MAKDYLLRKTTGELEVVTGTEPFTITPLAGPGTYDVFRLDNGGQITLLQPADPATATITGLTPDNPFYPVAHAQIGNEASIGAAMSDGSTITSYNWSQAGYGTGEFGSSANPTALDGSTLYLEVVADGLTYQAEVPIRHPEPVAAGSLVAQSWFQGSGPQSYDASAAIGAIPDASFAIIAGPTGISFDALTNSVMFDTDVLSTQTDTAYTLRVSNSGGHFDLPGIFSVAASTITVAGTTPPATYRYYATQTLGDLANLTTYQDTANYTSGSGITGVVTAYTRNGAGAGGADALAEGDTWTITFTVSQSAGSDRVFNLSGTAEYMATVTLAAGNVFAVDVNDIVPDTATLDFTASGTAYDGTYSAIPIGDLANNAYNFAGTFGLSYIDLTNGDPVSVDAGLWVTPTGNLTITTDIEIDSVSVGDPHTITTTTDGGLGIQGLVSGDDGLHTPVAWSTTPITIPGGRTIADIVNAATGGDSTYGQTTLGSYLATDNAGTTFAVDGNPVEIILRRAGTIDIFRPDSGLIPTFDAASGLLRYQAGDLTNLRFASASRSASSYVAMVVNLANVTGNNNFQLLSGQSSTAHFGQARNLLAGTNLSANCGTPTLYINGTAFAGTTHDQLHAAIADGTNKLIEITNIDLTHADWAWVNIGGLSGSGATFANIGLWGDFIIMPSQPAASDRTLIQSTLAARHGITLP